MIKTDEVEKIRLAKLFFTEGRPIHEISNLKKGNSSPEYDSESLRERSKNTAKVRAARYASAVKGMVSEK